MKKIYLFTLSMLALLFAGCTTYEYSARQVYVNRRYIDTNEQMAKVVPNYSKQVSATSSYQSKKHDAIAEAEFICIQSYKIDVVVDPIYKIEYNPWRISNRFKATIIGFAGTYENTPTRLETAKSYTMEQIEKYKLLYDPNFARYYYSHGADGDTYYFNTGVKEKKSEWLNLFSKPKKNK